MSEAQATEQSTPQLVITFFKDEHDKWRWRKRTLVASREHSISPKGSCDYSTCLRAAKHEASLHKVPPIIREPDKILRMRKAAGTETFQGVNA